MFDDNVRACEACPLREIFQPVPGEGNESAQIVIVGRNPGKVERHMGRPFMGPAGVRLDHVIDEAGLVREQLYITNAVKCFTESNSKPPDSSYEACVSLWLGKELAAVHPRLVIALGQEAQQALPMCSAHFPTFNMIHPSAALRSPLHEARLRQQTKNLVHLLREQELV